MSAPWNLADCYSHELADPWSANDKMEKVVGDTDENLSDLAERRLNLSAK